MKNFLITFQATEERTEGLALALGLGAVQRGGNIRLRHLSPPDSAYLAHQGYGRLKADDIEWADCLVVGIESDEPNGDLDELLRVVTEFGNLAALKGKFAFVFGAGIEGSRSAAVAYVRDVLANAHWSMPADELWDGELSQESMTAAGQRLAEMS